VVQVRSELLQQRIALLASRQFGVVSHEQLLRLGMSRSAIKRWLKQGRLHRIHRGVYLVGHAVPAPLAPEQAALFAAGDDSVLSHFTAARIEGLLEQGEGVLIHVTTSRFRGRPKGVVVHTSRRLEPRDVTWRHNLPVTTVERTLIDLAEAADSRTFERAVETAFAKRRVNERQLRAAIKRLPGRKGGARLAAYLDFRNDQGYTRSDAEDVARKLLRSGDLPPAYANDVVEGYEVDFHFRGYRVIVEIDSWKHHSDRLAFENDRAKWAALESKAYTVLPVTWRQITIGRDATLVRIGGAVALASKR
jgi:very-short-patch-repair endonuclease/predicted transcriptional regulator of viral defense system